MLQDDATVPGEAQTIICEMCSREAGQVLAGVFYRRPGAPVPVTRRGRARCGQCRGRLSPTPDAPASYAVARAVVYGRWARANDGHRGRY